MIQIVESEVTFGPFDPNDIYQIEQSPYVRLSQNIKCCEFVLLKQNQLIFIEAKSSIPREQEQFFSDVCEKFIHSVQLMVFGAIGKVAPIESELPNNLKTLDWSQCNFKLWLVIPTIPKQYLPPLNDKFKKYLKIQCKLWGIRHDDIAVLNADLCNQLGLIISKNSHLTGKPRRGNGDETG
jgi:hypothetical protein